MPDKKNQNLMKMIRAMHNTMGAGNIESTRKSQDSLGALMRVRSGVSYETVEIGGLDAEWVRVDRKHMKKYIILYCHGGGFFTGSLKYARTITAKLAMSTSFDVLSFDYRLAPEFPYPAALHDAMQVWDYLMNYGYGARDIILIGDSAGGNLALAMTLRLKEQERMLPRGMVLFSPWTDMTLGGRSHETRNDKDPILDEAYLKEAISAYAKGEELTDPYISPLFGDFTGFPPTYIQVGSNEVLLSDSMELHRRMVRQNSLCKLDIFKGMWHVFQMSPFKPAYEAMDQAAEFIFDVCR